MSLLRRRAMMVNTGSGQSMMRGNFTPESNKNIYTVILPVPCQNFMVWKHTYSVPDNGYRAFLGGQILHGEGMVGINIRSNSSGASWTLVAESNDTNIQIEGNTITINTGNSYFVPEQYDYIAW